MSDIERAEKAEEGWIKAERQLGNCCPLCGWDESRPGHRGCQCLKNIKAARKARATTLSVSEQRQEKSDAGDGACVLPQVPATAQGQGIGAVGSRRRDGVVPQAQGVPATDAARDDAPVHAGVNGLQTSDPKAEYLFPVEVVVRCSVQAPAGHCPDFDQRAYEAVKNAPREAVQVVTVWGTNVRAAQRLNDAAEPAFGGKCQPCPLPHPLEAYYDAISGDGPLAYEWRDKPHRLVYDLIMALRQALDEPKADAKQVGLIVGCESFMADAKFEESIKCAFEHVRAEATRIALQTDHLNSTDATLDERGGLINDHASACMRLYELSAAVPEVEKLSRKTPRKDMPVERAKVETAKARVEPLRAEIVALGKRCDAMHERLEALGAYGVRIEAAKIVG